MKHIIANSIYIILINIIGNLIFYLFNLTDILYIRDLFSYNIFNNTILFILYSFIIIISMNLILLKIVIRFNKLRFYFIISLITSIIVLFIFKYIFKIEKINNLNNILCVITLIILSTYVFYYSFYNLILIEYKRNH